VLFLCGGSSTPQVVAKLIATGAPVDAPNPEGQTPLMAAAAHGKPDNAKLLIAKGAKVNAVTHRGFTPLFFAAKSGSDGVTQAIVEGGGDIGYISPDGTTALHLALFAHNTPAANYLIEHGADLKRWDYTGRQPLHVAAETGDVELAKFLLAKGADPNGLTKTAFRSVPHQAKPSDAARGGSFIPASTDGDWKPKVVYMGLDGGVPPKPPLPATPLLIAAKAGSAEMMKVLIAGGAKPNIKAADGSSVLLAAVESSKLDAVQYALQVDPDVTATADGNSALFIAIQNSRQPEAEAVIQYLVDHGAPLDGKNERGQTAMAAAQRATPGVKALVAKLVAAHAASGAPKAP
jgi:ankyrin repeat protein